MSKQMDVVLPATKKALRLSVLSLGCRPLNSHYLVV